jgi:hypothetical protein
MEAIPRALPSKTNPRLRIPGPRAFSVVPAGLFKGARPGLRPGLSSAVPSGLSFMMVSSHADSLAHSVSIRSARLRSHIENGIEIPLAFRRKSDSRMSDFFPTPQARHKQRSIRLRCAVFRQSLQLAGACAGSPAVGRSCVPLIRLCTAAF